MRRGFGPVLLIAAIVAVFSSPKAGLSNPAHAPDQSESYGAAPGSAAASRAKTPGNCDSLASCAECSDDCAQANLRKTIGSFFAAASENPGQLDNLKCGGPQ